MLFFFFCHFLGIENLAKFDSKIEKLVVFTFEKIRLSKCLSICLLKNGDFAREKKPWIGELGR